MPTYPGNAYEILSQVRYGINEFSTAYVQGTDTTGKFANELLMRNINNAQYHIWSVIFEQYPEYFLKIDQSLSFVSSAATLPSECFKILEIKDSEGYPVTPIKLRQRHILSDTGTKYAYYRYKGSIRLDADSVTETGYISYYQKCRELDTGLTSAGGALSATLATTSKALADYYNDMLIENVTDSTVDTITDYSAARVCVVSNTWAASKYYGIVSDLPEIFQPMIGEYAILQMKKNPTVPLQPNQADVALVKDMIGSSLRSFGGTQNTDVDMDSIINNFEPVGNW